MGVASNQAATAAATDGILGNFTPSITQATDTAAWYRVDLPAQHIHKMSLRLGNSFAFV